MKIIEKEWLTIITDQP